MAEPEVVDETETEEEDRPLTKWELAENQWKYLQEYAEQEMMWFGFIAHRRFRPSLAQLVRGRTRNQTAHYSSPLVQKAYDEDFAEYIEIKYFGTDTLPKRFDPLYVTTCAFFAESAIYAPADEPPELAARWKTIRERATKRYDDIKALKHIQLSKADILEDKINKRLFGLFGIELGLVEMALFVFLFFCILIGAAVLYKYLF